MTRKEALTLDTGQLLGACDCSKCGRAGGNQDGSKVLSRVMRGLGGGSSGGGGGPPLGGGQPPLEGGMPSRKSTPQQLGPVGNEIHAGIGGPATPVCSQGFEQLQGDVPGWGKIGSSGGGKGSRTVASALACAASYMSACRMNAARRSSNVT